LYVLLRQDNSGSVQNLNVTGYTFEKDNSESIYVGAKKLIEDAEVNEGEIFGIGYTKHNTEDTFLGVRIFKNVRGEARDMIDIATGASQY
jgi:hypothetical protein